MLLHCIHTSQVPDGEKINIMFCTTTVSEFCGLMPIQRVERFICHQLEPHLTYTIRQIKYIELISRCCDFSLLLWMIFYFYLKRQLIYESSSHASCNWPEPVDPVVGPTPSYHTWSQGPGWVHTGAWGSRMYQQYLTLPYYSPVRGMANR